MEFTGEAQTGKHQNSPAITPPEHRDDIGRKIFKTKKKLVCQAQQHFCLICVSPAAKWSLSKGVCLLMKTDSCWKLPVSFMTPGFRSYPSVIKPSPSLQANNYLWSLVEFKKKTTQQNQQNTLGLGGWGKIYSPSAWMGTRWFMWWLQWVDNSLNYWTLLARAKVLYIWS